MKTYKVNLIHVDNQEWRKDTSQSHGSGSKEERAIVITPIHTPWGYGQGQHQYSETGAGKMLQEDCRPGDQN